MEICGRKIGGTGYGLLGKTHPRPQMTFADSLAGLPWRSTVPSEEQAFAAMHVALTSGCNLWNGGEIYGTPDYNSLTLLNKYYTLYPEDADKVVLNIKGATRPGLQPDGSSE